MKTKVLTLELAYNDDRELISLLNDGYSIVSITPILQTNTYGTYTKSLYYVLNKLVTS